MHVAPAPSPSNSLDSRIIPIIHTTPDPTARLLACAAHLSSVLGPWLVLPLIIYGFQRKQSYFVADHALRAAMLQLAVFITLSIGMMLGGALLTVTGAFFPAHMFLVMAMCTLTFSAVIPLLILAIVLTTAVRAYRGRHDPDALFARASAEILRCDPGVPRAAKL